MEIIIICTIVGYAVFLGYLGKDREIGFWKAMASGLWRNSFSSESAITRIMKSPKVKSNKHKDVKESRGDKKYPKN